MRTILKPFLEEHINQYELTTDEPKSFEHMINYLVARNYTSRHFDPAEISLGKKEVGIDGLAVVVNDTFVNSVSELESCFESSREVSVTFLFVQTKTSENFSTSDLNHFFASVNNFIKSGSVNDCERAIELNNIFRYVMEHPTKLSKNPDCHIVYAFTGEFNPENDMINNFIDQQKDTLRKTAFFDDVTVSIYDYTSIIRLCREIKNSIKRTIEFTDFSSIPSITNVKEAYLGVVRCKDFVKMITNEQGAIITSLFEDNVRYFQGNNTVNSEVQTTLRQEEKQHEFSILNNGITLVAKEVRITGKSITLSDFQVVNGCQTSFVLFENRNRLHDDTCVVLKIVSTTDKDITDKIVRTTNRQTPVLKEAFETLRDFHKNLENAYASYPITERLYYERRSKQYDSEGINKNRIISFPFQTTAYVAVFLIEPHSTHRYYGELLSAYKKSLYKDDDVLEQYCIASMYVFSVEQFIRTNPSYYNYRKYKHHIALMLRCIAAGNITPKQNSKEMKKLCDELFKKISDPTWVKSNIEMACGIIDEIISSNKISDKDGNQIIRQKEFTTLLLEKLGTGMAAASVIKKLAPLTKGSVVNCRITGWNNSFIYVELIDYREAGSIHIKEISHEYVYSISDEFVLNQQIRAILTEEQPHAVYGYHLSIKQLPSES